MILYRLGDDSYPLSIPPRLHSTFTPETLSLVFTLLLLLHLGSCLEQKEQPLHERRLIGSAAANEPKKEGLRIDRLTNLGREENVEAFVRGG